MLLLSSLCIAQPKNALSIATQPTDFGIGLRYDYHFKNALGVYTSTTYGDWGLYKQYDIRHHTKITTGISLYQFGLMNKDLYLRKQFIYYYFTAGLNYHILDKPKYLPYNISKQIYKPWSFELGVTCYMNKILIGMRTDILRWEPCIDIGYSF